ELDGRARQLPAVLLELLLESLEQRECICGAAGEARDHAILVEAAHLAGVALHDRLSHRDLAVAAERDAAVTAHRQDRRAVQLSVSVYAEQGAFRSDRGESIVVTVRREFNRPAFPEETACARWAAGRGSARAACRWRDAAPDRPSTGRPARESA